MGQQYGEPERAGEMYGEKTRHFLSDIRRSNLASRIFCLRVILFIVTLLQVPPIPEMAINPLSTTFTRP